MLFVQKSEFRVPDLSHKIMSGTNSSKTGLRKDYSKADGTQHIYLYVSINRKRAKLPTQIWVLPKHFDEKNQRIKKGCPNHNDINLMLDSLKNQVHEIIVSYRLRNIPLDSEQLIKEYNNPTANIDFCSYMELLIEKRKDLLAPGTYRHHKSKLQKLRSFKKNVFFSEIDEVFINQYIGYLKKKMKNQPNTINSNIRTLKTYLNFAKEAGIHFSLKLNKIKTPDLKSDVEYLSKENIQTLERYYTNEFTPIEHRNILQYFLFSCFTGCRYSDVSQITRNNIIGDNLIYTAQKTQKHNKLIRIPLSTKASVYINQQKGHIFNKVYCNAYTNRKLKEIQKACNIKINLSFHTSRHTFATLLLEQGGTVEVLQELMGHSNIGETMRYVHILDHRKNEQIKLLDSL
jgi:integrase